MRPTLLAARFLSVHGEYARHEDCPSTWRDAHMRRAHVEEATMAIGAAVFVAGVIGAFNPVTETWAPLVAMLGIYLALVLRPRRSDTAVHDAPRKAA